MARALQKARADARAWHLATLRFAFNGFLPPPDADQDGFVFYHVPPAGLERHWGSPPEMSLAHVNTCRAQCHNRRTCRGEMPDHLLFVRA